jgi:hypothetical protein
MLDMAESGGGGGRLRPNRHSPFTATNKETGGLCRGGDAGQIAFC